MCSRPILPPDFAVLALVPIDGIDLDALPASVRRADAVSVFVKRVDVLRFGQPLPVFVHCAKRQHDVNVRVSVAFVVIKEIADHAFVHKFLLTEIADEGKVLLVSQFARQGKEHRARRLRVDTRFRCVHRVPERLRIGIRFRRVGRQHDFNPLHARWAAVRIFPAALIFGVFLFAGVIGAGSHAGLTFPAADDLKAPRRAGHSFTSISRRKAPS